LLEEYAGIVRRLLPESMNTDKIKADCEEKLKAGEPGAAIDETLIASALQTAKARGKEKVFEHDFIVAVLKSLGIEPKVDAGWKAPGGAAVPAPANARDTTLSQEEQDLLSASGWKHRVKSPTPTLEGLARDLTQEAVLDRLPTVLGRETEVQAIMETLLRPTKRNPLLVGPAGVGKTAIIEGLAQKVVTGEVPKLLQNVRIFALQVADLVQGMQYIGSLEQRVNAIIKEAEQDGVILFLDEIHLAIGAGAGAKSNTDIANLLKPPLARGLMSCIGATTDVEYNRYITADPAFNRRFQPIRINELGRDATLHILKSRAARAKQRDGIEVDDDAMSLVISISERYIRNRFLPDKAIDLFDQAIARARLREEPNVSPEDIHDVTSRLIGMPIEGQAFSARLDSMCSRVVDEAGCDPESAEELTRRLQVTMRGLDLEPLRPNAVILAAEGEGNPTAFCRVVSSALFENDDVSDVDLSTAAHPAELSRLTGAAPGYVGYDTPPAFHVSMMQRPWSVVLFYRPDLAHPVIQSALASMLRRGWIEDGAGRRVFLSDSICVLVVAGIDGPKKRTLGFGAQDESRNGSEDGPVAAWGIDPQLDAVVDIRVDLTPAQGPNADHVLQALLLPMGERWARDVGVEVRWEGSVVDWLLDEAGGKTADPSTIARVFENQIAPAVVQRIAGGGLPAVTVSVVNGKPVVTEADAS
jgi:ATP-dependent Clp protease ATP-binding subunit ClpC